MTRISFVVLGRVKRVVCVCVCGCCVSYYVVWYSLCNSDEWDTFIGENHQYSFGNSDIVDASGFQNFLKKF